MFKSLILSSLVLGAVLIAGCESKDTTPPPAPAAGSSSTAAPSTPAVPDMPKVDTSKMGAAADQAKQTAADAANQAKQTASDLSKQAKMPSGDAANQVEAQTLMTQVSDYIKQNKLADAETVLTKLEGMKASLPQSMQDSIDGLRKQLTNLKALGGGTNMPSMPAMPK